MDSLNDCASCWRKRTDKTNPCGQLNDAGVCPDCAIAIAQEKDIKYMTYAKHRNRQHERRRAAWAAASPEEKRKDIARRYDWLNNWMRMNPAFSMKIAECRFCGTEPALHSWPAAFRCACGEAYVVDRWFPDNIERVHRMIDGTRYCLKCETDKPVDDFYQSSCGKENWCKPCRGYYDYFGLNTEDVLFLYRAGCAEWNSWANSSIFMRVIDEYGTGAEKKRLASISELYRHDPIATEITPEDRKFLTDCGIRVYS